MADIPYATIEDVEKRLGYELDTEEAAKAESFLDDFSLIVEASFLIRKKSPNDVDPRLLQLVVARRTASYMLMGDLLPGQTSFSETIADRSISGSVSSSAASDAGSLVLTPWELTTLGLGSSRSFYTIDMVTSLDHRRSNG